VVAVIIAARLPIRDNSYLWHVRAGTVQMEMGSVLTTDPFSFTAMGRPWRTQSWLADIAYGWLDERLDLRAVPLIVAIGSLTLVLFLGLRCYRMVGSGLVATLPLLIIMWLTLGYFTPRPVLLSLALFGVVLVVTDHPRLRWTIPLLFWLWAAVHGAFVVGLGYLVLAGIRRRDRRTATDILAATIAVSLTAHGWGAWQVLVEFAANRESLNLIVEWLTPNLISFGLFPFALAILLILWGGQKGRLAGRDLWVVGPFLLFAFTANRAVSMAAMALLPWIADPFRPTASLRLERSRRTIPSAVLAAAAIVVPLVVPLEGGLDQETFPVAASAYLIPGPAYHDDGAGGYLIYRFWPERTVFVDDRAELYGPFFAEFVKVRDARPGWREVLARYDIHQALVRVENPLGEVLRIAGWREAYADDVFVVLREGGDD
jgi:hypothetical protein